MKRGVDYIGVSVAYLIFNAAGQVAIHKRGPACRDEVGTWDTGSGALEFGENPEDAVRRESSEELGIDSSPEHMDVHQIGVHSVVRESTDADPRSHWRQASTRIVFVFVGKLRSAFSRVPLVPPPQEQDHVLSPVWIYPDNVKLLPCHSQVASHMDMARKHFTAEHLAETSLRALEERARWIDLMLVELPDIATWINDHLARESIAAAVLE